MELKSLELDSFGSLVRDVLLSVGGCSEVYCKLQDFLVLVDFWLDRDCWLEEELDVFSFCCSFCL